MAKIPSKLPSLPQHPEYRVIAAAREWAKGTCDNAADTELFDAVAALNEHEGKSPKNNLPIGPGPLGRSWPELTKTVKHGRKTRL